MTVAVSPLEEVKTIAMVAGARPARVNASRPVAMASRIAAPARRRSAGGSKAIGGGSNGAGRYAASPFRTARDASQPSSPGPADSGAFDEHLERHGAPNTRLQLLPPKPNELLSTRSTRAGSAASW